MNAKKFRMNELREFIYAVQTRDSNPVWAKNLKQWFDARISELAKNTVTAEIVANDRSEVLSEHQDFAVTVSVYESQIRREINAVLQNISPSAAERFFLAYDSYQASIKKLDQMRSCGVLYCIKKLKKYCKLLNLKNKRMSLYTLAEVACCLYIESGLGDEVQARKFFHF